jgi:hypothetical protein
MKSWLKDIRELYFNKEEQTVESDLHNSTKVHQLTGLLYLEPVEFTLVIPVQQTALHLPIENSGERRTKRSSPGKKKKLNYAFLKPETVETKEECRPASAIRKAT